MKMSKQEETEAIQKVVARIVATQPVGRNLALIGGFRYRFLDESAGTSDDIDYHWAGDLVEKQDELIGSFRRILLPEISRRFGYSGRVDKRTGPDADSQFLRIVDLVCWKDNVPHSRIEIPVEITRIACVDPIEVRTAGGTIYATASEGDMIESKVLAILNRINLRHRDIVDMFLFQDRFLPDSDRRLAGKLRALKIGQSDVRKRISDLHEHEIHHARAVQEIIDTQLDTTAANQLNDAGGGKMILDRVVTLLTRYVMKEGGGDEGN